MSYYIKKYSSFLMDDSSTTKINLSHFSRHAIIYLQSGHRKYCVKSKLLFDKVYLITLIRYHPWRIQSRVNLLLKVMVTEHYYFLAERCNKSLPAKEDGRF